MAQTPSATQSSSREGSRSTFGPTVMTSRESGGRRASGGYSGVARLQSSLNRGSSFSSDVGRGMRVERRARWVVSESRVSGWVVERDGEVGGGVISRI